MNSDGLFFVHFGALALFVFFVVCALGDRIDSLEQSAIERGHALHCPHNGKFAWNGECEGGAE